MRKLMIVVALACLTAVTAAAAPLSSFYVVPFANHIPRADGVEKSDLVITNTQNTPIKVSVVLISYGMHNTQNNIFPVTSVTVPPLGSALLTDVLQALPGDYASAGASLGALLVATDDGSPFAVTSRSYIQRADGSTAGSTIPATANFLQNATVFNGANAIATIPGVRNNAQYRTQVGFVIGNAEGLPTLIEFTLLDMNGNPMGSPRPYYLDPGLFAELEVPVTLIADQPFDVASVRVRVVGGGAVTAYAKVIDKTNGDAAFISADQTTPAPGTSLQTPFQSLMQRMGAIR